MVDVAIKESLPDQSLLDKFSAIDWTIWRQDIVNNVLKQYDVKQIAALPRFAAEHLFALVSRQERGLRVTVIPNIDYKGMTERQVRRFTERKKRIFNIEGMMLADFERMPMTDQFLFLNARIPKNTIPSEIVRWIE